MTFNITRAKPDLLGNIRQIIDQARTQVQQTVNSTMVQAYANIDELLADKPQDYLRAPYLLDFLSLGGGRYQKADLEQAIIDNLQKFLLELGKGFAFVERQQRIITNDGDDFIDLVFYNFHLKCFVLIDLKLNKLSHQDVGQMDMYVRLYEEQKRRPDDNPTIGLILCSERNETVAKYYALKDSQQLFASKYLTQLPSEEALQLKIQKERERIEAAMMQKGDNNFCG
ncbi:DUF1016 family protein [Thiomicrospira microaerophila]|uniref:PDDEXK nuclease domain-containing protein n=1 Tax=Thiomicrospira microaerophila TaxID=406020 RepID=UPI00200BF7AF|nr:PDDEXK nuclease domain-containing protein [Thiomicrospira microaerophila]UQB43049.1 DUF1016 family protein [Thiomicrospira microaerophila]